MTNEEVMNIFTKTEAYKKGHFKLSSGLHSDSYLQCALVLQDPKTAAPLCEALAVKIKDLNPTVILGPAMGGVVFAYEMARSVGVRSIFSERNDEGKMALRRGFSVSKEDRIVIAEDVLTTGKSVKEVISLLAENGVAPVGVVSLVDRSGGKCEFGGIRVESLLKVNVPTFDPADCPLCKEGKPIEKPGSRK
ncbi:MAG: orotate phosphoribosyltransferase [Candidatus Omnitrophica bacterium]|nr:orotate phosphoribosyltransferase [Candidatus Omnitrophota bacterium]